MPRDQSRIPSTAPGRQKSCTECVKSKRRCDLQRPRCLRCTRQNLTCSYPGQPAASHQSSRTEVDTVFQDTIRDDTEIPFLGFDFDADIENMDLFTESFVAPAETQELDIVRVDSCLLKTDFSITHIQSWMHSRMDYPMEIMQEAPSRFLLQNQTPWSHSRLYEDDMPQSLQDAYATASLYTMRNDTNSAFFVRHITSRVDDLLRTNIPTKPLEILGRAHALILYEVMFAFSGDIRLHSHIQRLIGQLQTSAYSIDSVLQRDYEPLPSELPIYPATTSTEAWRSFIFHESCRRTLVVVLQVAVTCSVLLGHVRTCTEHVFSSFITCSTHLWNAPSSFDFAVAWNEKPHWVVKNLDFSDLLENAPPDDVDTYGRMMLVAVLGLEHVKGWFHSRRGKF